ncbi:hypothetical protein WME98_20755 [Sorangium sp. So ce296]|uniref:hypothetical protein n=1 Tax=Sorangium sp. So ce296 TaxID=3133296 RepID=UPI003F60B97A
MSSVVAWGGPGPEREPPLGPRERERQLSQRLQRPREAVAERAAREHRGDGALDRGGDRAVDLERRRLARLGGGGELRREDRRERGHGARARRIGLAGEHRDLARERRGAHPLVERRGDREQHRAQRRPDRRGELHDRVGALPQAPGPRGQHERSAGGAAVPRRLAEQRRHLVERAGVLALPPGDRRQEEPGAHQLDPRQRGRADRLGSHGARAVALRGRRPRRVGQPRAQQGVERGAAPGPPAHPIERQQAAAVGRQRPGEPHERLLVGSALVRAAAVDHDEPAERVDPPLGRVRAAERALRRGERLVLRLEPLGDPLEARRGALGVAAGALQRLERPPREAGVANLLLREARELRERVDARRRVVPRPRVRALADADERLDEGRHVVQGRRVLAQRRARRRVAGVARRGLDPGLDGAIGARERAGVEPRERRVRLGPRRPGPLLGPDLEPRGHELVEPCLLEHLVDRAGGVAVDLPVEARVEHAADRARPVALARRALEPVAVDLRRALQRGRAGRRALAAGRPRRERFGVRPEHLVGGAVPAAHEQRGGHGLGGHVVVGGDLEGAQAVLERRLPLARRFAPLGRLQVRLRRGGGEHLLRRPGGDRAEQLARHRVVRGQLARLFERVDRARDVAGARQEHGDLDQHPRRRAGRLRVVAEAAQRRCGQGRLAQPGQPAGQLAPHRGVVAQRERPPGQRRRPIELDAARGEDPREGEGRLALSLRVAGGAALVHARAPVGFLSARAAVARHRRDGPAPSDEQLPRGGGPRWLHQLRRMQRPPRARR